MPSFSFGAPCTPPQNKTTTSNPFFGYGDENKDSQTIKYELVLIEKTKCSKIEIDIDNIWCYALKENITEIEKPYISVEDMYKMIEEQRPDLIIATKSVSVNGRYLTDIVDQLNGKSQTVGF